jgi:hypothetical protein
VAHGFQPRVSSDTSALTLEPWESWASLTLQVARVPELLINGVGILWASPHLLYPSQDGPGDLWLASRSRGLHRAPPHLTLVV